MLGPVSYLAPDPGRRRRDPVELARLQAELLRERSPAEDRGVVPRPQRDQQQQAAGADPPILHRLLAHEQTRSVARSRPETPLATGALADVVRDLDVLLELTAQHLRQTDDQRTRQLVRDAVPQLAAMSTLAELPLAEAAEFLDLPDDAVRGVVDLLARDGGLTAPDRQLALAHVEALRAELRTASRTNDHSLLDRLLGAILRIALAVGVAVAAAPLAALAVGESVVKEVVKAALTALVAVALDQVVLRLRDRARTSSARAAHEALLGELAAAATGLTGEPAYDGEDVVLRTRLLIRCGALRVALVPLAWEDKRRCWELLDNIATHLDEDNPRRLARDLRKLRALTPP